MGKETDVFDRLVSKGVSRRDFMKFSALMATTLGLAPTMAPKIAEAVTSGKRPTVIWLHFAECTGCSEAVLRSTYPWIDELILDILSIDYHETIMAAAGHQAEGALQASMAANKGQYICVIEGAIPTKNNGTYGMIAGKTMLEMAREVTKDALAVICIGACATFGGVQAAAPNPTGAKSVSDALGIKTINVAGCPPNPANFVATVVHYLLLGKLPDLDDVGRPLFAYGQTIHNNCPRRGHYEEGEYVQVFGDEGTMNGWCLLKMGCRGPDTFNNCSILKFNDGISWPIGAGAPCIGCSEPDFWDKMAPFYVEK